MKKIITRFSLTSSLLFGSLVFSLAPVAALAHPAAASNSGTRLQRIITRGDTEISRRLKTLNNLDGKISAAAKLSASDKSSLDSEIKAEISGLTALKTKLDADTDTTVAVQDAASIITEYRVYALVVPKAQLLRAIDAQLNAEAKLTALAGKLQARITSLTGSGKDVATKQSTLADMTAKVAAAQKLSSQLETSVLGFTPASKNSNPTILVNARTQLQTAQVDILQASSDAQNIINALK